jgi:hypothetical protein
MAHSALGLVAYKRGNLKDAVREFELAENLAPDPDPGLHYRLGTLYKVGGDTSRAVWEFQNVVDSNDPALGRPARKRLKTLPRVDPTRP